MQKIENIQYLLNPGTTQFQQKTELIQFYHAGEIMSVAQYLKDPDAVLDYGFDWSDWLADGETISTSTWTIPTGLTEDSETETTTATKVWLSGGTAGTDYTITNKIVTSDSRTDERSMTIRVQER